MKLLVVRDHHEFATHLGKLIEQRAEAIVSVPVAWDVIGVAVDLQKLIQLQEPEFLICAVRLPYNASKVDRKKFQKVVELLERCSRKFAIPLIFLSTAAVFHANRIGVKEEQLSTAESEYGLFYAALEDFIIKKQRKHIILRTSWWFSSVGDNFLTAVINYAAEDLPISLNSAAKSSPTAEQDIARVVLAILLQLTEGAENWGVYHYSSADAALGFQFMEAIVAQAGQYDSQINAKQLKFEHNDEAGAIFYFEPVLLKCEKLLEHFGIHQRSWRSYLPAVIKSHYEWASQFEEDRLDD